MYNVHHTLYIVLMLTIDCPAKINLFLHIRPKVRRDGYHELYSLMCKTMLCDKLTLLPAEETTLENTGEFAAGVPTDERNLILKADMLLREAISTVNIPNFKITVEKNIPAGGGLGGGSSNAAKYLELLVKYLRLTVTAKELAKLLLKIGSDTAFFLGESRMDRVKLAFGRGNILKNVGEFPKGLPLLIAYPGFSLSTAEVYKHPAVRYSQDTELPNEKAIAKVKDAYSAILFMNNDLESAAFAIRPELPLLAEAIEDAGALKALLTGSGSCIFGIYKNTLELNTGYNKLVAAYPHHRFWKTETL